MTAIVDDFTADELAAAYRRSRLRYIGISLTRALTNPLFYKSLCLEASAMRKKLKQHGKPAPEQQALIQGKL